MGGVDIKADTQVLGIWTIPPAVFDSFFFARIFIPFALDWPFLDSVGREILSPKI